MPSFSEGFAGGLQTAIRNKNVNAELEIQRQAQARQDQLAQSQLQLNDQALKQQTMRTQQMEDDQNFQHGVVLAASKGGLPLAMEYATKQGRYDWVQDTQAKQLSLNRAVADNITATAQGQIATVAAVTAKTKALAGIASVVAANQQAGVPIEQAYAQALPSIKEIWPQAPDKYTPEADSYLKIALAQHLPQSANYGAYGKIGQNISGYQEAQKNGDVEAANYFKANLAKMNSLIDPMTGSVMSFSGPDAPQSFPGTPDTKAAAAGLGAGSRGTPTGVTFQGQAMNNFADKAYQEYDQQNGIKPEDRKIRNLKPASGYETVVHPDGTVEQQAIEGGPASKLVEAPERSGKVMAIAFAQRSHNKLQDILIKPDGTINRAALALADFSIPGGKGTMVNALNSQVMEGYSRSLTGASITDSDMAAFQRQIQPSIYDSDETIKQKLLAQHEVLNGNLDIIKRGRNAEVLKDEKGNAQLDWDKIDMVVKAGANGGSVLDVTRGDGFNPEKMRQNKLKQLSYSPEKIKYYMSAQYNGQGRDLTPEEAKQLIDAYAQANQPQQGAPQ